jgi:hypothetical protein
MMDADLHERIRRRAYELWEQEGRPEGRALDHWHQAEAEVAGVRPGAGSGERRRHPRRAPDPEGRAHGDRGGERTPSDLAADEAAKGGGGVGP